MGTMVAIVVSMRPKQWIKNLIVLAPVIFALPHFRPEARAMVLAALAAMALFSLASSGVYLLNDILDRDKDRHHPEKQHRPIAAGVLSVPVAIAAMIALFALALGGAFVLRPLVMVIISGYIVINLLYSYVLKNLVIVDAFSIAFGFILRMLAGAEALHRVDPKVEISTWIILCTMLGSFFLAFCKRRQELSLEDSAVNHRASLEHYSVSFLDQMISISCAATVMAYALWTMWPETVSKFGTRGLFWTVPFVCYGIFRYLYLVHQKSEGGSPTKVFLSDRPLQINIALWFTAVVAILYFRL
jgi:4-hydroxybenzoate polyprenyltransferase